MEKVKNNIWNPDEMVVRYGIEDKNYIFGTMKMDDGIGRLVDAVNTIYELITISSCQGPLIKRQKAKHQPITYVDFYALNHQYDVAMNLQTSLVSKFGACVLCSMQVEPEYEFDDEAEEFIETGLVSYRFRIEIPSYLTDLPGKYDEIVKHVRRVAFKDRL